MNKYTDKNSWVCLKCNSFTRNLNRRKRCRKCGWYR